MIFNASNFNSTAFEIFGFSIKWYGLAYMLAFIGALYLITYITKKENNKKFNKKFWDEFLFYVVAGIVIGGRLGYVLFYNLPHYIYNPLDILAVWNGGMSFHGGGLGMLGAALLFSKKQKVSFWQLSDYLMIVAPIGLFLGRIANFVNQELYGKFTNGKWGVIFNNEEFPRHPTQLYEAFLEGIVLFIAMLFLYKKTNVMKKHGMLTGIFFILYGVLRTVVELFRLPDTQLGYLFGTNWLTMGMVLCFAMVFVGSGIIYYSNKKPA